MPKRQGAKTSVGGKTKKAKVEDPVQDSCKELSSFFENSGRLPHLSDSLLESLSTTIHLVLCKEPAQRHAVEQIYAKAVGEVLEATIAEINQTVDECRSKQASLQEAETTAQDGANAAEEKRSAAAATVETTQETVDAAEKARDDAVEALKKHQTEVQQLGKTEAKLVKEEKELAEGLEALEGVPAAKEQKKLLALLTAKGVSPSCVCAMPSAFGKTEGFEAMVLNEAKSALGKCHAEVKQQLADWDSHCKQMNESTAGFETTSEACAETLTVRQQELETAETAEKAAKAAKKEADAVLTKAKKAVATAVKATEAAEAKQADAGKASKTYQELFAGPAEEPQEAEQAEAAAEEAAEAEPAAPAVEASIPTETIPTEPAQTEPVEANEDVSMEPATEELPVEHNAAEMMKVLPVESRRNSEAAGPSAGVEAMAVEMA